MRPATASELGAQRIRHVQANESLGCRASGMQGSRGTGTAWPYYRPAPAHVRFTGERVVEFVDAVGGGTQEAE